MHPPKHRSSHILFKADLSTKWGPRILWKLLHQSNSCWSYQPTDTVRNQLRVVFLMKNLALANLFRHLLVANRTVCSDTTVVVTPIMLQTYLILLNIYNIYIYIYHSWVIGYQVSWIPLRVEQKKKRKNHPICCVKTRLAGSRKGIGRMVPEDPWPLSFWSYGWGPQVIIPQSHLEGTAGSNDSMIEWTL